MPAQVCGKRMFAWLCTAPRYRTVLDSTAWHGTVCSGVTPCPSHPRGLQTPLPYHTWALTAATTSATILMVLQRLLLLHWAEQVYTAPHRTAPYHSVPQPHGGIVLPRPAIGYCTYPHSTPRPPASKLAGCSAPIDKILGNQSRRRNHLHSPGTMGVDL